MFLPDKCSSLLIHCKASNPSLMELLEVATFHTFLYPRSPQHIVKKIMRNLFKLENDVLIAKERKLTHGSSELARSQRFEQSRSFCLHQGS